MARRWHTSRQVVRRWVRRYPAEGEARPERLLPPPAHLRAPHACGDRGPGARVAKADRLWPSPVGLEGWFRRAFPSRLTPSATSCDELASSVRIGPAPAVTLAPGPGKLRNLFPLRMSRTFWTSMPWEPPPGIIFESIICLGINGPPARPALECAFWPRAIPEPGASAWPSCCWSLSGFGRTVLKGPWSSRPIGGRSSEGTTRPRCRLWSTVFSPSSPTGPLSPRAQAIQWASGTQPPHRSGGILSAVAEEDSGCGDLARDGGALGLLLQREPTTYGRGDGRAPSARGASVSWILGSRTHRPLPAAAFGSDCRRLVAGLRSRGG